MQSALKIYCRQCASEIPAENISLDNLVAKCAVCNAVFDISGEVRAQTGAAPKPKNAVFDLPMPSNMSVTEQDGQLVIRRRWFSFDVLIYLAISLFWNAFVLLYFLPALNNFFFIGYTIILLPFIALGVYLAYETLLRLFNTTTISVNDEMLTVRHGPLPTVGGGQHDASRIAQVFVREHHHRGRNTATTYYSVNILRDDRVEQKLIGGLTEPRQGLFIEQEIEKVLHIENRPVRGEYKRD